MNPINPHLHQLADFSGRFAEPDETDVRIQELIQSNQVMQAFFTLMMWSEAQWYRTNPEATHRKYLHLLGLPKEFLKGQLSDIALHFSRCVKRFPQLIEEKHALAKRMRNCVRMILVNAEAHTISERDLNHLIYYGSQALLMAKNTQSHWQQIERRFEELTEDLNKVVQYTWWGFWKHQFDAELRRLHNQPLVSLEQAQLARKGVFEAECNLMQKNLLQWISRHNDVPLNQRTEGHYILSRSIDKLSEQITKSLVTETTPKFSVKEYHQHLKTFREIFSQNASCADLQKKTFDGFRTFFEFLLNDAVRVLGAPPCAFDFRCMGSWGRREGLPRSDLEFFILIESREHYVYFLYLIHLLNFQFKSLGETQDDFFSLGTENGLQLDVGNSPKESIGDKAAFVTVINSVGVDLKAADYENSFARMMLKSESLKCYPEGQNLFHDFMTLVGREIDPATQNARNLFCIQQGLEKYKKEWEKPFSETVRQPLKIKDKFQGLLVYLLADLSLYFGIVETNTLEIIDVLVRRKMLTEQTGALLKSAHEMIYKMCLRLGLLPEPLTPKIPLNIEQLQEVERNQLSFIYWFVIRPLYHYIDKHIEGANFFASPLDLFLVGRKEWMQWMQTGNLRDALGDAVDLPNFFSLQLPGLVYIEVYALISRQLGLEDVRESYLQGLRQHGKNVLAARLAEVIANPEGVRVSEKEDEQRLRDTLFAITKEGKGQVTVKIPGLAPRYLNPDVASHILTAGTIKKQYIDCDHPVIDCAGLHFKQDPYQPMMEYAIHCLMYRLMGRATPATQLVSMQVEGGRPFPVLISQTILGERLGDDYLNARIETAHFTWMLLCTLLTKQGDGHCANYVIHNGVIYCVDNDISFVEPIVREFGMKTVRFSSALFFLNIPLDEKVLKKFCELDPMPILKGWLRDLKVKQESYLTLSFPPAAKGKSFNPSFRFPKGGMFTLLLQFRRLQLFIETQKPRKPLDFLRALVSLGSAETPNHIGPFVQTKYVNTSPKETLSRRLAKATSSTESMTREQAEVATFGFIPSAESIKNQGEFSLEAAQEEFDGLESSNKGNFLVFKHGDHYVVEADFENIPPTEHEKQMIALQALAELANPAPPVIKITHCTAMKKLGQFIHAHITHLNLQGSDVTDAQVKQIAAGCLQLDYLNLRECSKLTALALSLKKLSVLILNKCVNLNNLNLSAPNLRSLEIKQCPILELSRPIFWPFAQIATVGSPLIHPARRALLKRLVQKYADNQVREWEAKFPISSGFPIEEAVERGNVELVQILLEEGLTVKASSRTARAVVLRDIPILHELKVDLPGLLLLAIHHRQKAVIDLLLSKGVDTSRNFMPPPAENQQKIYLAAIELNPNYAWAYYELGTLLMPQERIELPDGRTLDQQQLYLEAIRIDGHEGAFQELSSIINKKEGNPFAHEMQMTLNDLLFFAIEHHQNKIATRLLSEVSSPSSSYLNPAFSKVLQELRTLQKNYPIDPYGAQAMGNHQLDLTSAMIWHQLITLQLEPTLPRVSEVLRVLGIDPTHPVVFHYLQVIFDTGIRVDLDRVVELVLEDKDRFWARPKQKLLAWGDQRGHRTIIDLMWKLRLKFAARHYPLPRWIEEEHPAILDLPGLIDKDKMFDLAIRGDLDRTVALLLDGIDPSKRYIKEQKLLLRDWNRKYTIDLTWKRRLRCFRFVAREHLVLQQVVGEGHSMLLDLPGLIDKDKMFDLAISGDLHQVVELLLQGGAIPSTTELEQKLLVWAAQGEHRTIIELLWKSMGCLLRVDPDHPVLHWAASEGHQVIMDVLFTDGLPVNLKNRYGRTPLHYAVEANQDDIVDWLLANGALNTPDELGKTPAHLAAEKGFEERVGIFLEKGCDIHQVDSQGNTMLHLACENDRAVVTLLLLTKGASREQANRMGRTPLHLATVNKHKRIMEILLDPKVNVNPNLADHEGITPFHLAAANGDLAGMLLLIEKEANPRLQDRQGRTPLHGAPDNAVAMLLYHFGDLIDIPDLQGRTPLYVAAANNQLSVMESLLACRIDVHFADSLGDTPLHIATKNGHVDAVRMLLDKGADPNKANKEGNTPLHLALKEGYTPLHLVLNEGHSALKEGNTPFHLVLKEGNAPFHLALKEGNTPFHLALKEGNALIQLVLKEGNIPIQLVLKEGYKPIHSALMQGWRNKSERRIKIIGLLLRAGADPEIRGHKGNTALHLACRNGHLEVAKHLVKRRVKQYFNDDEQTPMQLAMERGYRAIVRILAN